jgi:hypothetical protein
MPTARSRLTPQDFPPAGQAYYTLADRALRPAAPFPPSNWKNQLPRPPNYKQEKKRREDQQKKKNEAKQREIAERKKPPADPQPP